MAEFGIESSSCMHFPAAVWSLVSTSFIDTCLLFLFLLPFNTDFPDNFAKRPII